MAKSHTTIVSHKSGWQPPKPSPARPPSDGGSVKLLVAALAFACALACIVAFVLTFLRPSLFAFHIGSLAPATTPMEKSLTKLLPLFAPAILTALVVGALLCAALAWDGRRVSVDGFVATFLYLRWIQAVAFFVFATLFTIGLCTTPIFSARSDTAFAHNGKYYRGYGDTQREISSDEYEQAETDRCIGFNITIYRPLSAGFATLFGGMGGFGAWALTTGWIPIPPHRRSLWGDLFTTSNP